MRKNSLFWGIVITLLGIVLLLNTLGILPGNSWSFFWPLLLILLGAWLLLGPVLFKRDYKEEPVSIPLNNAAEAKIKLRHGGGRLNLAACENSALLVEGICAGGMEQEVDNQGSRVKVKLRTPSDFAWGTGPGGQAGYNWNLKLNQNIPLTLVVKTGASETNLELTNLKVIEFSMETGASASRIAFPSAAGFTRAWVKSGAASVDLRFPPGVAARIRIKSGMASINVDPARFPLSGDFYESPDFKTAANRVELDVETDMGSVDIC